MAGQAAGIRGSWVVKYTPQSNGRNWEVHDGNPNNTGRLTGITINGHSVLMPSGEIHVAGEMITDGAQATIWGETHMRQAQCR